MDSRFEPHCRRGVLFWCGPLASSSLQIASVGLDHRGKKYGGSNQWILKGQDPSTVKKDLSLPFLLRVAEFLASDI